MISSILEPAKALCHTNDLYHRRRRKTRVVLVGDVAVGGDNPLRLQSMTTTDTLDTEATIAQTLRMVEAGCEIVRITTPTEKDSRNLEAIKEGLLRRGCGVPLVADVHFKPLAAMEAAEWAEKIRINPGNFVDGKRFAVREYSDAEYALEMERIEERFTPLVEKLKRLKRALRIGANHGSLSDRILNRYGDTPLGMVESALEYVRICRKNDYHDIILSMKASNPKVMIAAYRLLAARMTELGMDYPFHLGVTEAGFGEDGRVKSAVGIGSLLEDGIGDTIRVSLTEDPEREIPVCRTLAAPYAEDPAPVEHAPMETGYTDDLFSYTRRLSDSVRVGPFRIGGGRPVRAITDCGRPSAEVGRTIREVLKKVSECGTGQEPEILEWDLACLEDFKSWEAARSALAGEHSRVAHLLRYPGCDAPWEKALSEADMAVWSDEVEDGDAFLSAAKAWKLPLLVESKDVETVLRREAACREAGVPAVLTLAAGTKESILHAYRRLTAGLRMAGSLAPIHLTLPSAPDAESTTMRASAIAGSLFCDGIGDSLKISAAGLDTGVLRLAYNILQASGVRITKTEYISCPSCGRTLFDLQETTERIKAKTHHLKGVKIAIMGCIVNGPGEMADADFGYVGGAPDRINLYVGKDCVRKGVPTKEADQALINLIKENGKWTEIPS